MHGRLVGGGARATGVVRMKAAAKRKRAVGSRKQGKAPRKRRAGNSTRPQRSSRMGLALGLTVAAALSGVQVVFTAHELREVHRQLETTRHQQDRLLAEHSRLLLERGALAAYQHVERVAGAELDMQFPNEVQQILP